MYNWVILFIFRYHQDMEDFYTISEDTSYTDMNQSNITLRSTTDR